MQSSALSTGQLLSWYLCYTQDHGAKCDHQGLFTNSLQISWPRDWETKRVSDWPKLTSAMCLQVGAFPGWWWQGKASALLWLSLGSGQDGWVTKTAGLSLAFLGDKGRKNYKGKRIRSIGLPNIEKVNPDNSPSSDEHRGGTWQEKRWCYCQKSLSMLSGLFPPTVHHSGVTEVMPSLKSGQMLHVFNAHMPNKQHVAFLFHWPCKMTFL